MIVKSTRLRAWLGIVATMCATWGTSATAYEALSPLAPVSSESHTSLEPVYTGEPTPASSWIQDDQAGVTGCDCKPGCLYCPCLYGSVDYLFLNRTGERSVPLLVDANDQSTLVTTSQAGVNSLSGMRATFGLRCGDWGTAEFGYLNYFDSNGSLSVSDADFPGAVLALPGDLGGASNVFNGVNRVQATYGSQFNSYELNFVSCCVRECCDCNGSSPVGSIEWLAGFRYMSLNEQFNIYGERDEIGGVETGNYNAVTTNDLYGAQIGVRGRKCWGRISGEVVGKAGLFANQASQSQYMVDFPDFNFRPLTSTTGSGMAFGGELGITGIYQINQNWGLRAGYNLIWLQGLALAPEQLDYTFTPESGTALHRDGGLFLHGLSLGVEARW